MKPISYVDAMEEVRKYFFALKKTNMTPHSAMGIYEDGGRKASILTSIGVKRVLQEPDRVIRDARINADAFDALRYGAAQHVALGIDLPVQIQRWVAAYPQGRLERPTSKPGRPSKLGMELEIHGAVRRLVEKGLPATRSDASEASSACDAVAQALTKLEMKPSSYDRVKKSYLKIENDFKSGNHHIVEIPGDIAGWKYIDY